MLLIFGISFGVYTAASIYACPEAGGRPSYPLSFLPQEYSCPSCVASTEWYCPQPIDTIFLPFRDSMSVGKFLSFVFPSPNYP